LLIFAIVPGIVTGTGELDHLVLVEQRADAFLDSLLAPPPQEVTALAA
jgi:hypothetical protein